MKNYTIDGKEVKQILLPDPADTDPHPSLIFDGCQLSPGEVLTAWMPGRGFVNVRLELRFEDEGIHAWYFDADGCRDICPVGVWCVVDNYDPI